MTQALAAIGASSAANPVAGPRGNARNGVDAEAAASSFDSLLGPQAEAPGDAPKAGAGEADRDSETDSEDDQENDAKPASTADDTTPVSPQLPAWLLALRLPPATGAASDTVGWGEPANPNSGVQSNLGKLGFVNSPQPTVLETGTGLSVQPFPSLNADAAVVPDTDAALNASQTSALAAVVGKTLDTLAAQASTATVQASDQVLPLNLDKSLSINATTPAAPVLPDPAAALRQMLDQPLALDAPDASLRLGERLRWLAQAGVQEARLQLHPRELGVVDIRIRIEGQSASVWFGADHAHARAALEAAIPVLRDRFAADGLVLSQTQVGGRDQQPAGQGRPDAQATPQRHASADARDALESSTPVSASAARIGAREVPGLIDRYV